MIRSAYMWVKQKDIGSGFIMTTLGLFLVGFGLLTIVIRLPYVVAPERTRSFWLRVIEKPFGTRWLGLFIVAVGLAGWLSGASTTGQVGEVTSMIGFILAIIGSGFVLFAVPLSPFFQDFIRSSSPTVLRIAGALAVLFGIWVITVGIGI